MDCGYIGTRGWTSTSIFVEETQSTMMKLELRDKIAGFLAEHYDVDGSQDEFDLSVDESGNITFSDGDDVFIIIIVARQSGKETT